MKRKTILITGATGFLGSYITRKLHEEGFQLILIIRGKDNVDAMERSFEIFAPYSTSNYEKGVLRDGIEIVEGDVSQRYFGLNAWDYLRLAETADEVFHCAAVIKFDNDSRDTLTRTNVIGTQHVARFCLTRKIKRLHYVSTAYVAGKRRGTAFESELEQSQEFNNNYERSKFDAERELLALNRQYQIPCTVYRPSIIIGDTSTGFTKNFDNIYVFGKYLCRLKELAMRNIQRKGAGTISSSYPVSLEIPGDKYGTINLVPVDYVASAIIAISMRRESINKTFHIVNPSPPTLGELAAWMMTATGFYGIRIAPVFTFQTHKQTLQEKAFLQRMGAFLPYLYGELCFDSSNTRDFLRGTGIECSMITGDHINMCMQYAMEVDWGRNDPNKPLTLCERRN